MPIYDVNIFLTNGITARIKLVNNTHADVINNIEQQLLQPQFRLTSQSERAIVVIKKPQENIAGYFVDEI
jgi:hypothetical protein